MRIWAAPLMSLLLVPGNAQTITTGEVTGRTMDQSGAIVSGATITLKNVDMGESRSVKSNASGLYRLAFIRPGKYEISAFSAGLKSDTTSVIVAVGQVQVLDLKLRVEGANETIVVSDSVPLLQTDNANVAYTVSPRQMEMLPLPGGDLVAVAYTMPGVVVNNRYGNGSFASQGLGSMSNLFTTNGVDNMDPYYNVNNSGVSGLLLGANEIREVSLVQNAYEGQYGRQAGTQVNYVSKSGANDFHGSLLYNYTGTLLTANDFFSNREGIERPHEVSNQYGAAAGGRIVRDKLFFFADTEGLRLAFPWGATVASIPSPELQSYTLRTIQPAQVPFYRKVFDLYNNAPGHERAVLTTTGSGPLQDGSGNGGCAALAGTPTGTGRVLGQDTPCTQSWAATVPGSQSEWLLSTRIDYNVNSKHRLFWRFKTDHGNSPSNQSPITPLFDTRAVDPDYEGQVSHTWVFSPRLVNDFIGAVTYNDYVTDSNLAAGINLLPIRINFLNGGVNSARVTNIGVPAAYPSGRRAGQFQIIDDVSYNAGRHSFKAGVNYRYNRESDLQYSALGYVGRFSLQFGSFANGVLTSGNSFQQSYTSNRILHLRLYNAGMYVQDQWALSAHLKLSATIRFDRTGNPKCIDRCFSRLIAPFPDVNKDASIPYNRSIQSGLDHAFYKTEALVPQPRFSAVFSPSWQPNTVVRGGIGFFSDLYPAFFAGTMAGNAPNVSTPSINFGLVDASGAGSAPAIAQASATVFQREFGNGATLAQLQSAVAPVSFSTPSYFSLPSIVRTPKFVEWSFDIQHQFAARYSVTLRYAGNHGYDIFLLNPNVNATSATGLGGLPATAPDRRFGGVSQLTNNGYSNYHGLTLMVQRAFGRGFQGQIAYTWSHALDTASNGGLGFGTPNYPTAFSYDSISSQVDPRSASALNYSSADYDVRHNVTADFIWEMPVRVDNPLLKAALGGWSVASKLNARTGTPFSVTTIGFAGFPDILDPHIARSCGHAAIDKPCFATAQFASGTARADLGNQPRNYFRGPEFVEVDSSVYKTVTAAERWRLRLGVNAYNLLNHANLDHPVSNTSNSSFGLINSTVSGPSGPYGLFGGPSGRAIVIAAKLSF
jgi:hypothetical protein